MNNNIILIGPVGVGKTSVAKELATKLNLPMISMDTVRISYYKELGYDPELGETPNNMLNLTVAYALVS